MSPARDIAALAAATTRSGVKPNCSNSTWYGALAPKCSMLTHSPRSPTMPRQLIATPASTLTRAVTPRGYLGDIGEAIESYAETQGVSVVREWGGHGIGRELHEPPSVSHNRQQSRGPQFRPGLVFTIEPMINLGKHDWKLMPDKWTVKTQDGSLSAQFEHTLAVRTDDIEILTLL